MRVGRQAAGVTFPEISRTRGIVWNAGTPDRTRTCYPRLRRPVLYPDELRARSWILEPKIVSVGVRTSQTDSFGRGDRIRTYDILVPNQARYRAALHPD